MELLKKPLKEYLVHRFGPGAVLEKATRFPRGSSRLTWFIDYRPEPGAPVVSVIFRGDFEGGSTIRSSLEQEYFMYERLGHTDVPVAKVLGWEDDPEWAVRPFYIREQIQGSWEVPNYTDPDPVYDEMRIAISKEHLSKLAIVHNIDWHALGFNERLPVPADEASCGAFFVENILHSMEDFGEEPVPLVLEAVDWLKRNAPVAPRISLCKGTNGLGEEVLLNGKIVAMSDWEEASIGDPAADFASLQDFIPEITRDGKHIWGMPQALAFYREVSGINVTLEAVKFYQITRALGTIGYGHSAAVIVQHGKADIRQAWTGTEVFHLGKRILAASIGLPVPIDAKWFGEMNETIQ